MKSDAFVLLCKTLASFLFRFANLFGVEHIFPVTVLLIIDILWKNIKIWNLKYETMSNKLYCSTEICVRSIYISEIQFKDIKMPWLYERSI